MDGTSRDKPGQGAATETKDPAALMLEQMGQSWKASLDVWSAWMGTWRSFAENRAAPAGKAALGQLASPAAWPGGFAPFAKELEDIFGLPRFADVPMLDSAAMPSFAPAMELMAVAQQYMLAAAPVWAKVCQRFQAEVAERRARGEATDSSGDAMDLWNAVLDQTLMEFNRSAEFGSLQQRFLHAATRQRLEVRKLAEGAARAVDMPTRSEMDDVYRRLHDLRKEVHELRGELRTMKRDRNAGAAKPAKRERT